LERVIFFQNMDLFQAVLNTVMKFRLS
jgi:hypothetical protein